LNASRSNNNKRNKNRSTNKTPSSQPPTSPKPKKVPICKNKFNSIAIASSIVEKQPYISSSPREHRDYMERRYNFQKNRTWYSLKTSRKINRTSQKMEIQVRRVRNTRCGESIFVNRLETHASSIMLPKLNTMNLRRDS
jgi:hypothetical protein